jgi:hypothetical protein
LAADDPLTVSEFVDRGRFGGCGSRPEPVTDQDDDLRLDEFMPANAWLTFAPAT